LIPLVVVPLAFAAAALLYYFAKTSLGVPSAAPAGPGLHDGQLTVLAGQMKWVAIASMIVTAPLVEEFILRGLMLPALAASRLGFIGATILTTFLFVIMHTGGLLKFSSVAVLWDWHFLSSLGLCATWYFTRSVWPCVLAHAAMNLAVVLNVLRLLAQGT
jgi:membrane protease YdiL (CAAX protease family)